MATPSPATRWWIIASLLVLPLVGIATYFWPRDDTLAIPQVNLPPSPPAASEAQVRQFCGACHAYPPPSTLPRSVWRKEVNQGYDFFRKNPRPGIELPPLESVALYYEQRAPAELPLLPRSTMPGQPPVVFEPRGFRAPELEGAPAVSHVQLAHLFQKDKLDLLVCDTGQDQIWALKPALRLPVWQSLAKGYSCAHVEIVDLDGDGRDDLILACLGNFYATNDRVGSVVWLRSAGDGSFTPITLLEGVGRVADARVADFNDDGKLDLVVAVFGWREIGQILYLENRTTDWSRPVFVPHVLDERSGASHVPVADLDGDGRPDFVALISQEHETVVCFRNDGNGRFQKKTLYAAPHPTFGCSGIQLVDLDGDGDLDVLLANGDVLDAPYLLKPYHGVQWLENRGNFAFVPHRLTDMYGAMQALACDVDGDGDLDIVVVSYLPAEHFPQREKLQLDSIVLLEQTEPSKFVRHSLETIGCDHLACAVGDVDGDGRPDLVVGRHARHDPRGDAISLWRNLGKKK